MVEKIEKIKKTRHDNDEKTCKTRVGNAMQGIPQKNGLGNPIIDGLNNVYCNRLGLNLLIRCTNFLNFFAKSLKHVQCSKV